MLFQVYTVPWRSLCLEKHSMYHMNVTKEVAKAYLLNCLKQQHTIHKILTFVLRMLKTKILLKSSKTVYYKIN